MTTGTDRGHAEFHLLEGAGGSFPHKPSIFLPPHQINVQWEYSRDVTMRSYFTTQCVYIILTYKSGFGQGFHKEFFPLAPTKQHSLDDGALFLLIMLDIVNCLLQ